jgi:superfamily II DNA or RNA helicase
MRQIPVIIDSHLRIDGKILGRDLVEDIFDELTFPNQAKISAERAQRWEWWKLPDEFCLGDLDGDQVILPRGYAFQLKLLLREHNLQVQWIDKRTWKKGEELCWLKEFTPRKHQPAAKSKMRHHEQGIYEAPTGSGKSLTCIYLIQELSPQQTIILVDKISLLDQWKSDIESWLDIKVGVIGASKWDDTSRIVVATFQTIWSAIKKNQNNLKKFFKRFSCVIIDECHHVSAESIQNIVGRFTAKIREGVSATPDRNDSKFLICLSVLGEVFHTDDEEKLRERGVLVKPSVKAIRTEFEFEYWSDHESGDDNDCLVPKCKFNGKKKHRHANNYQALKTALIEDDERNNLICNTLWTQVKTGDHHHLMITDEVRQVEALYMKLLSKFSHNRGLPSLYVVTGKVKGEQRKSLFNEIKSKKSSVLISTVAKEGLDIPVIDRIYLPFPSSNVTSVQQKIGRGTRSAPGKTDCLIFDFQDIKVGILKKQFKTRANHCYRKLGIEVIL